MEGQGNVPAAWHEDPWDPSQLRWWDGSEWTGHTHPKQAPAPVAEAQPATQTQAQTQAQVPPFQGAGIQSYSAPGGGVAPSPAGSASGSLGSWLEDSWHWIAAAAVALLIIVAAVALSGSGDEPTATDPATGAPAAADDAQAMALVRTAQTAAETYATDHNGRFSSMTLDDLVAIEPTLEGAQISVLPDKEGYVVTLATESGNIFSIQRGGDSTTTRTCTVAGQGGCPPSGLWG